MQSPRPSSKTISKKRAAARKRNRDFLRRFGALFFVFIFVLGTATTAFLFTGQTAPATTDTSVPTAAAQSTQVVPTDLAKKGDEAMAANKLNDALSYYQAAAALDQGNAELHYKIGDVLIQMGTYDSAADQLNRAVELDKTGPVGVKAQALIDKNKDKLPTRVPSTGAPAVQGVVTDTGVINNTKPITSTGAITSTNPASPTLTTPK
jgi:tetratricopeptide (TPR) repeat protein